MDTDALTDTSTYTPPGDKRSFLRLDGTPHIESIGRREFSVGHSLVGHPLFSLEALAQLADTLPRAAIECHAGKQPLLLPGGAEDLIRSPSETVRTIDSNGCWMVLWNIEQIPPYRRLIDQILDEVSPHVPAREKGMGRREAFLFLSAPRSVTPVHFDPEHNFLLQLRGCKEMHVGRFSDRAWELRELDRYYGGGHRNLLELPPEVAVFTMQPGDGVYLYPWAPHWVCNGPAVSISLSVTFRTRRSQQQELVNVFNARLRRHGIQYRPAGESALVDSTKAMVQAFRGWVRRGGRRQRGARDYSASRTNGAEC